MSALDAQDEIKARVAGVEQMMGKIRRMTLEIGDVQDRLLKVTGSARSPDGLIKATVGPRGHLVSLEIDARIYRRPNSTLLAQIILDTVRQAVEQAGEQVHRIYQEFVPEEFGTDKIMSRVGLPDGMLRQHDADLLRQEDAERVRRSSAP